MGAFRFSRLAEADLPSIGAYTLSTWGKDQMVRYLNELEACCRKIADNPALGRPCENIRSGLHRREQGKHVIFFRLDPVGVLISRILHERMLPRWHVFEDEGNPPLT